MVTVQRPPFLPVKPMRSPMKASLVLAVGLFLVIAVLNQSLKTEAAPQGIFSFQLAATAEQSGAILQSWGQESLAFAELSLWLGLLFTVAWLASLLQLRSEEHTSELQSRPHLVCRLLLEKKKKKNKV